MSQACASEPSGEAARAKAAAAARASEAARAAAEEEQQAHARPQPAQTEEECIGYGCSPEQDAAINESIEFAIGALVMTLD